MPLSQSKLHYSEATTVLIYIFIHQVKTKYTRNVAAELRKQLEIKKYNKKMAAESRKKLEKKKKNQPEMKTKLEETQEWINQCIMPLEKKIKR